MKESKLKSFIEWLNEAKSMNESQTTPFFEKLYAELDQELNDYAEEGFFDGHSAIHIGTAGNTFLVDGNWEFEEDIPSEWMKPGERIASSLERAGISYDIVEIDQDAMTSKSITSSYQGTNGYVLILSQQLLHSAGLGIHDFGCTCAISLPDLKSLTDPAFKFGLNKHHKLVNVLSKDLEEILADEDEGWESYDPFQLAEEMVKELIKHVK
jgi:hypothetical protein